jgi:hypothetical protein
MTVLGQNAFRPNALGPKASANLLFLFSIATFWAKILVKIKEIFYQPLQYSSTQRRVYDSKIKKFIKAKINY